MPRPRRLLAPFAAAALVLCLATAVPAFGAPPSIPTPVYDGYSGADVQWSGSAAVLQGNWGASTDPQNSLRDYTYCYSTTANFTGCIPSGTFITNAVNVQNSGLSLVNGTLYHVCVYATNTFNESSSPNCSDGSRVDVLAPLAPAGVRDGTGADVAYRNAGPLAGNWDVASDGAGIGTQNYDWCVTTDSANDCGNSAPLGGGLVQWGTTVGTSANTGGTALTSGTIYYVCVTPRDQLGNVVSTAYTCSNGQLYDTVAPSQPLVLDGPGADQDYSTDLDAYTELHANWTAAVDNLGAGSASGFDHYEYCVSTATGCSGTVVQGWTSSPAGGTATSVALAAAFSEGVKYFTCVRAYDVATNFSQRCSNGQIVDLVTPAAPAAVDDGAAADVDWTMQSPARLRGNWSHAEASTDLGGFGPTTLFGKYEYCISTSTSGADCAAGAFVPWTGNGVTPSFNRNPLSLVHGTQYFTCVRSWDNADAPPPKSVRPTRTPPVRCSDGQTIDGVAPDSPASTTDETGFAVLYTPDADHLAASWAAAADDLAGVERYDYCFTTTATGSDCAGVATAPWTANGLATTVDRTGLTLSSGTTYRVCVRTVDRAGNMSPVVCSTGQTVDTQLPPVPASVADGAGADDTYLLSSATTRANWPAVVDALSGLKHYEYCVSTSSSGADCSAGATVAWDPAAGTTPSFTHNGLTLTEATVYYTCVRAVDRVDNASAAQCSNGQMVDTTKPLPPASVSDGSGADVDLLASTSALQATWPAGSDGQSGVAGYDYCVSTDAGGSDCAGAATVPWTTNGAPTSLSASGLTLVDGTYYHLCVRIRDNAGRLSSDAGATSTHTCSDGFRVDVSAPATAAVRDGATTDVDGTADGTQLTANWDAVSDPYAPLDHFDYCISTSATGADCAGAATVAWTANATSTSVTKTGLVLSNGTRYYTCVRAQDTLGTFSTVTCSNGQAYDVSPPSAPGPVNDGPTTDAAYIGATSSANWTAATDATALTYEYCVTESPTGADCGGAVAWVPNGAPLAFAGSTTLVEGTTYYACVRSRDWLGTYSLTHTCSNGAMVDPTPPAATTAVRDGSGADISHVRSLDSIAANWDAVTDTTGSTLWKYEYCVSTGANCTGTVVQTWKAPPVPTATSMSETTLTLAEAATYRTCVRAVDFAGNASPLTCSNGITTDTTAPPAPPEVRDGAAADVGFQNSASSARANWTAPADTGSGTASYEYCVALATADCAATPLVAWTPVGSASMLHSGLALANGARVFVCVRAIDAVGNTGSHSCSNGAVVDTVQPTVGPSGGTWTNVTSSSRTLSLAVGDDAAGIASATAAFLGRQLPVNGGTIDLRSAPEGRGTLVVTITDVAGNVSTYSQPLLVDFTAASVKLRFAKKICTVKGGRKLVCRKSKKLMPQPLVTKKPFVVLAVTDNVAGPMQRSVRIVKLKRGRNVRKLRVADKAGNWRVQTVTIYRLV